MARVFCRALIISSVRWLYEMELINVMREKFRNVSDRKFKNLLEKLVDIQDVFLIQPKGSGKFES